MSTSITLINFGEDVSILDPEALTRYLSKILRLSEDQEILAVPEEYVAVGKSVDHEGRSVECRVYRNNTHKYFVWLEFTDDTSIITQMVIHSD